MSKLLGYVGAFACAVALTSCKDGSEPVAAQSAHPDFTMGSGSTSTLLGRGCAQESRLSFALREQRLQLQAAIRIARAQLRDQRASPLGRGVEQSVDERGELGPALRAV